MPKKEHNCGLITEDTMKRFVLIFALLASACISNQRAKYMGGTMIYNLDAGEKFINMSWEGNELWIAHRPRRVGETPEVVTLHEKSQFGVLQGTIIIREH
jgi:hypothetical protein